MPRTTRLVTYVTAAEYQALTKEAQRHQLSLAALARRALRGAIKRGSITA